MLVVLCTCTSTKQKCELARDAALAEGERMIEEALESVADKDKADMRRRGEVELDAVRASFVSRCTAADNAVRECILRLPQIIRVQHLLDKALGECPEAEEARARCRDKHTSKRDEMIGMCDDKIASFLDAIYQTAR